MALTQQQVNGHLRAIVAEFATPAPDENGVMRTPAGVTRFLATCRDYAIAGGPDEKEAARIIARYVYEKAIGRPPTADDLHILTSHRVAGGEVL